MILLEFPRLEGHERDTYAATTVHPSTMLIQGLWAQWYRKHANILNILMWLCFHTPMK